MQVRNLRPDARESLIEFYFKNLDRLDNKEPIPSFMEFLQSNVHDVLPRHLTIPEYRMWSGIYSGDYSIFNREEYGLEDIKDWDNFYSPSMSDNENKYYRHLDAYKKTKVQQRISFKDFDKKIEDIICESDGWERTVSNNFVRFESSPNAPKVYTKKGIKDKEDKLVYEIDWEFVEEMAKRMAKNKSKYPKDNWKKPIDIQDLKDSLTRHFMAVIMGDYSDEGDELGGLAALAINAMMIRYQLKHNQ